MGSCAHQMPRTTSGADEEGQQKVQQSGKLRTYPAQNTRKDADPECEEASSCRYMRVALLS